MNIASVDLNVLLGFEALLEERSVTRAAARVGLSQPAMSNVLGRLRTLFGDRLFIRIGYEMTPTARALELAGPVRSGLAHLRSAFDERPRFDPAVSTRSFRLALTDYAELVLVGDLLGRVQRSAPDIQIVVRRPERIFIPPEEDIGSGKFDLAVGFYPERSALDPNTHSQDLFAEDHVCIGRQAHPLMEGRFGLREFAAARHLGIFYRPDTRGLIDNILASHGISRRLLATMPDFLSVPYIVAQTDLIAVVPAGLAARYGKILSLDVRKAPIRFPRMTIRMLWHARADGEAAHQWLRSEILKCARTAAFTKK